MKGHRISVLQVSEWILDQGMSPEEVSAEFDLELSEIYAALSYYYENVDRMNELRELREKRIEEIKEKDPLEKATA